jgi:metal-dependent HD superfamily phosphatase/phosphodiesterase
MYGYAGTNDVLLLPFRELEADAIRIIGRTLKERPKAWRCWQLISTDPEVRENWMMANFVAVTKMGMNDHGEIHAKIATASALTMLDLLLDAGRLPDIVRSGYGDLDDAALVITAATLCHDFGNSIHRIAHENVSVQLALPVLDRLLLEIYPDEAKRFRIRAFILSAIYTHHGNPPPLTLEAGLVCVGDSSDMTKGRGRQAFDSGSITIHTVSALAVNQVVIQKGAQKPIELRIYLSNSAGIFQVQEVLAPKVRTSSLAESIEVVAIMTPSETEEQIVKGIRMEGSRFVLFADQ